MINKLFLSILLMSFITHMIVLHVDEIYIQLNFELTEEEQKILDQIEENKKQAEMTMSGGSAELLAEQFEEDKERAIEEFKKNFLKNGQDREGPTSQKGTPFRQSIEDFKNFTKEGTSQEEKITPTKGMTIRIVEVDSFLDEPLGSCDHHFYGVGLSLGKNWEVTSISPNHQFGAQIGDKLLGFLDINNKFHPHNSLILKNEIPDLRVVMMVERRGVVIRTSGRIYKVCYDKHKT